jgi:hypothetical protein
VAIDPRLHKLPAGRARPAAGVRPTTGAAPGSSSAPPAAPPAAGADGEAPLPSNESHKVLGLVVDQEPVAHKGGAGQSARAVHLAQVRQRGGAPEALTADERKLLKDAFKELGAPGKGLAEHLALRAFFERPVARAAFDRILAAHADALLPELLAQAAVFVDPPELRRLGEVASAMGRRAELDAHLVEQLVLARGWAKNHVEHAQVDALAAALGLAMPAPPSGTGPAYEASAKHHGNTVQGGFISPAPTHGQRVLEASVQVKPSSPRRVGVDQKEKEFVVFDMTIEGVFHGHTRTWDQLHPDMKSALVANGLCTDKGKIL